MAPNMDLRNMNVAIVGGTRALGRKIALFMASHGAKVLVIGRKFRDQDVRGIEFLKADLSSMFEVKMITACIPAESLDLLIFANTATATPQRRITSEGIEKDMAMTFLSRMVIMNAIAGKLGQNRATKARVFILGFPVHYAISHGTLRGVPGNIDDMNCEKHYSAMQAHANTTTGNEILILDTVRHYQNINIYGFLASEEEMTYRDNLMGPGSYRRVIDKFFMRLFMLRKTPENYLRSLIPMMLSPRIERMNGAIFNDKGRNVAQPSKFTDPHVACFMSAAEALVEKSARKV